MRKSRRLTMTASETATLIACESVVPSAAPAGPICSAPDTASSGVDIAETIGPRSKSSSPVSSTDSVIKSVTVLPVAAAARA